MIQSRSLPGYQVSSSLTGGGVGAQTGCFRFAWCVTAPKEQHGLMRMRPHRGFPAIALFVVRSSRIYCLYCRNWVDGLAASPGRVVVAVAPGIRSRMATLKRFRYGRHAYLDAFTCTKLLQRHSTQKEIG
jgi:hypothetical protein